MVKSDCIAKAEGTFVVLALLVAISSFGFVILNSYIEQLNADGLQGHREWLPVSQRSKVDHHPGQGHWFNAGLSPNINVTNQVSLHNSPQFQAVPYAHANSYGSIGSYGSYNDVFGMGSSYGSLAQPDPADWFPNYRMRGMIGLFRRHHYSTLMRFCG